MSILTIFLALVALLVLALLFAARGIPSGTAPLCAVCATSLYFTLAGCLGILRPAGWFYYLLAAAGLGWLLFRRLRQKKPLPALGFGFWFFAVGSVVFILLLMQSQPMFTTWDEFHFWGTAAKLLTTYDQLYTTAPVGWPWPGTFAPVLPVLSYFVQFWGTGFLQWQTYAAYNLLALAAFAALLAPFEKKEWNIALPLAVVCLVSPYLFTHYAEPQKISAVYLDSLGDVPMGLLFGAALAAWYGSGKKGLRALLSVCLVLPVLALAKDTGFALALLVAAVVFADLLAAKRPAGTPLRQKAGKALLAAGALAVLALLAFFGWKSHLSLVSGVSSTDLGGANNMSMLQMPVQFLKDLFASPRPALFDEVMQGMAQRFLGSRVTLLGTGAVVSFFILAMVGAAALITKDTAHRRSCLWFGLLSALGFAAYTLLIAMTYIYIFRPGQQFASYERYLYPYYIGWFLAAAQLLALSARQSRFVAEGKAAVLALAALCTFQFVRYIPVAYTIAGIRYEDYNFRRASEAEVRRMTETLNPDGKTFVVIGDDGLGWFTYCFEFLPHQLDYSFGGSPLVAEKQPEDGDATVQLTPEELRKYLLENNCTYLFIDHLDDRFVQDYGALFADGLQGYDAGDPLTGWYLVTAKQQGPLLLPMNT